MVTNQIHLNNHLKLNHDLGLESSSSAIGHVSAKFKPIDYSDIFDIKKNKKKYSINI